MDKKGSETCAKGVTRDDLRHFLAMREAGAVLDRDAEAVARHLERDDCSWCLRENAFLYWTEPGLTTSGRARYEQLINGLNAEQPETAEPAVAGTGEQPSEASGQPAAAGEGQRGSHLEFALWNVRKLAGEAPPGNTEQYCVNLVGTVRSCFPPALQGAEREEVDKNIRREFHTEFNKLPPSLKKRAAECGYPRRSGGERKLLREVAEGDEDLMIAVALQMASLIPSADPFPLLVKDGQVWLDFKAYLSGMRVGMQPHVAAEATERDRLSR